MKNKRLKVLLLNDKHYTYGGAEKYFFMLKNALKKYCDVYSFGFSPKPSKGKDFLILKEPSLIARHWSRLVYNKYAISKFRQYVKDIKPDIIHINNLNIHTFDILSIIKDYPVIMTVHDYSLLCPEGWNTHRDMNVCSTGLTNKCWSKHRQHNWIIYLTLLYYFKKRNVYFKNNINLFIAPNNLLQKYLKKNNFKNILVLTYLIKKKSVKENAIHDKLGEKYILYVGGLEKNKGVHILLEEFAILKKSLIDKNEISLKIVGKGSQENNLKKQAENLGISESVKFIGWKNNLDKYYDNALFVVVPSLYMEQFGLVTSEAMMRGKAIIGSDRGGTKYLLGQKSGVLFNPIKKGDLAKKMNFLINNDTSRNSYGRLAKVRINKLVNNTYHVDTIIKIYKKVIFSNENSNIS